MTTPAITHAVLIRLTERISALLDARLSLSCACTPAREVRMLAVASRAVATANATAVDIDVIPNDVRDTSITDAMRIAIDRATARVQRSRLPGMSRSGARASMPGT